MGMGIDQWEWEGMGILLVFPHVSKIPTEHRTSRKNNHRLYQSNTNEIS